MIRAVSETVRAAFTSSPGRRGPGPGHVTEVSARTLPAVAELDLGTRRDERGTLYGSLDWYRAVVEHKVEGLSREDAGRPMTPSGLSPLGIVQHLGHVHTWWFRSVFAGQAVDDPGEDDPDADFRVGDDATVESVVAFYGRECDHARRIADATPSLDDVSARPHDVYGLVSLRWVLVHMLEETARHAGHLDLMREQLDGRTGD